MPSPQADPQEMESPPSPDFDPQSPVLMSDMQPTEEPEEEKEQADPHDMESPPSPDLDPQSHVLMSDMPLTEEPEEEKEEADPHDMEPPSSPDFDPQSPVLAPMTLVTLMGEMPTVLRKRIDEYLACDGWDQCFSDYCHCLLCYKYGSFVPVYVRTYVEITTINNSTGKWHSTSGWICPLCADDPKMWTEKKSMEWMEGSQLYWTHFASDIADDVEMTLEAAFAAATAVSVASQAVHAALNSTDNITRNQHIAEARAAVNDSIAAAELAAACANRASEKIVADPFILHDVAHLAQEASLHADFSVCTAIDDLNTL